MSKHTHLLKMNLLMIWRRINILIIELLIPVILMMACLLLTDIFNSKEKGDEHLIHQGAGWYDDYNGPDGQSFFDYDKFGDTEDNYNFRYWLDREYGADRKIIALAPSDDSLVLQIQSAIQSDIELRHYELEVRLYKTKEEIKSQISQESYEKDGETGICFGAALEKENNYEVYMIFNDIPAAVSLDSNMPYQKNWQNRNFHRNPDKASFDKYKNGGYMYIQNLFANALLREKTGDNDAYVSMIVLPSKISDYRNNKFERTLAHWWSFLMSILFIIPICRLVYYKVQEKNSMRKKIKILGLPYISYWMSSLLYYTAVITIQSILTLSTLFPLLGSWDKFLILLYLWIFGMSLFSVGYVITVFFSNKNYAVLCCIIIHYLQYILTQAVRYDYVTEGIKTLSSIFPLVGAQLAGNTLFEFNNSEASLDFKTASDLVNNYRFSTWIWMNVITFFVLGLLGIYFEAILPLGSEGKKHPWFLFTKSFWSGSKNQNEGSDKRQSQTGARRVENHSSLDNDSDSSDRESHNVDLHLLKGEILVLLGKKGSGKSTILNKISEFVKPSSNDGRTSDWELNPKLNASSRTIKIWSNNDYLYPYLTVSEHLYLYSSPKSSKFCPKIQSLLFSLNLSHKSKTLWINLTPEESIKLSLAISIIASPQILILSDLLSNLDSLTTSEILSTLQSFKSNFSTIITSTILSPLSSIADRVGIISLGRLVLCTSFTNPAPLLYLGYSLTFSNNNSTDARNIEELVSDVIPNAVKVGEDEELLRFYVGNGKGMGEVMERVKEVEVRRLEEMWEEVGREEELGEINRICETVEGSNEGRKRVVMGRWKIFWGHFLIVFWKRFTEVRRNLKGIVLDLVIPWLMVFIWIGFASIELLNDSGMRTLKSSMFPLEQRCLYNTNGITGGGDPATLINLLGSTEDFAWTGVSSTIGATDRETLENFDDILYDEAQEDDLRPYRFGSYYFETLDYTNNQYKVVTFANSKSQEAAVAFPQFMYEAVLRRVAGSDFKYTMVNDPMPVAQIYKDKNKIKSGVFLWLALSFVFALLPTSIAGFILNEKLEGCLHQQLVNGMNKMSYWAANFWFDVIRCSIIMFVSIISLYVFGHELDFAWLLMFLFPAAIVAYTYAITQFFSNAAKAQVFTLFHHIIIGGIVPIIILTLRINEGTEIVGDVFIWFFRVIPSYNLWGGLLFISSADAVAATRNESYSNEVSFKVIGGDILFLWLHPFAWLIILLCFSKGWFKCLSKRTKANTFSTSLQTMLSKLPSASTAHLITSSLPYCSPLGMIPFSVFPQLTIKEHFKLYLTFKNSWSSELFIDNLLKFLYLSSVADSPWKTLEKSRVAFPTKPLRNCYVSPIDLLKIGLAVINNPKIVMIESLPTIGEKLSRDLIKRWAGVDSIIVTVSEKALAQLPDYAIFNEDEDNLVCLSKDEITKKHLQKYKIVLKLQKKSKICIKSQIDKLKILEFLRKNYEEQYKILKIEEQEKIKINKEVSKGILNNLWKNDSMVRELSMNGLGKELYQGLERYGWIDIEQLISWKMLVEDEMRVIEWILEEFEEVEIKKRDDQWIEYWVPMKDVSLRTLYQFTEYLKHNCNIEECFASQIKLMDIVKEIKNEFKEHSRVFKKSLTNQSSFDKINKDDLESEMKLVGQNQLISSLGFSNMWKVTQGGKEYGEFEEDEEE